MEDIFFSIILRNISFIFGVLGVVLSLDLLLGARITKLIGRTSQKIYDIDKSIEKSSVRNILGIMFFILSLLILLSLKKV